MIILQVIENFGGSYNVKDSKIILQMIENFGGSYNVKDLFCRKEGEDHCVKSVQIQSYCWSVFSPNTGKYGPEITPYLDTIHAVDCKVIFTFSKGYMLYKF